MGKRVITSGRAEAARVLAVLGVVCSLLSLAGGAELRAPSPVQAGQALSISTGGSGRATFYLIGPDHAVKRTVTLGDVIQVQAEEVSAAGTYQAILCSEACQSTTFEVRAAAPAVLSFFLHPSRVPVSTPDSIDATAFVFDRFSNLVLEPEAVEFRITPANGAGSSRQVTARNGIAWMRMDSTAHEGRVQVAANLGPAHEPRVIQQVAAEACGLRMKALPNRNSVVLETDPVRDCSGNALPDGTVVTFTKVDQAGKTTVDTPIKKGIAQTQFNVKGPTHISVACGVVLGNEVALNGAP